MKYNWTKECKQTDGRINKVGMENLQRETMKQKHSQRKIECNRNKIQERQNVIETKFMKDRM